MPGLTFDLQKNLPRFAILTLLSTEKFFPPFDLKQLVWLGEDQGAAVSWIGIGIPPLGVLSWAVESHSLQRDFHRDFYGKSERMCLVVLGTNTSG